MPNNEEDFNLNPAFLKHRIDKLEELVTPLLDLVNSLDKKVGLLAQKMVLATAIVGVIIQAIGIWYSSNSSSGDKYTEQEKIAYYEKKVKDTETINALRAEIEMLKKSRQ